MSEILSWIQWLDKNGVIAFLGTALFVAINYFIRLPRPNYRMKLPALKYELSKLQMIWRRQLFLN